MTAQIFFTVTAILLLLFSLDSFSGLEKPHWQFNASHSPYMLLVPPYLPPPNVYTELYWHPLHGFYVQQQWGFSVQQQSRFPEQQHMKEMGFHPTQTAPPNALMNNLSLYNVPNNPCMIYQIEPPYKQVSQPINKPTNKPTNMFGLQDLFIRLLMLKQVEEGLSRLAIDAKQKEVLPTTHKSINDTGYKNRNAFELGKIDIKSTNIKDKPAGLFIASDAVGNTIVFSAPRDSGGHELANLLREHCKSFTNFDINEDTFRRIASSRITPRQIQDLSQLPNKIDLNELISEINQDYPGLYTDSPP